MPAGTLLYISPLGGIEQALVPRAGDEDACIYLILPFMVTAIHKDPGKGHCDRVRLRGLS